MIDQLEKDLKQARKDIIKIEKKTDTVHNNEEKFKNKKYDLMYDERMIRERVDGDYARYFKSFFTLKANGLLDKYGKKSGKFSFSLSLADSYQKKLIYAVWTLKTSTGVQFCGKIKANSYDEFKSKTVKALEKCEKAIDVWQT